MNSKNFFAELKRRNVYKVAVAYAVVGWLVMQVAATVVPALHLPGAITSAVVLLTLLGFPIALVLAWAFELTPEGIKRTEDAGPDESITRRTGRKITALFVMLALAALGLFLFRLVGTDRWAVRSTPADDKNGHRSAAPLANQKSVAVLPFSDLSAAGDQQFFGDGLAEELLNVLVQIDGLSVASRTSSFAFKGKNLPIPEIARTLGVAHIVEGSVRRANDRLRVTAQLVDVGAPIAISGRRLSIAKPPTSLPFRTKSRAPSRTRCGCASGALRRAGRERRTSRRMSRICADFTIGTNGPRRGCELRWRFFAKPPSGIPRLPAPLRV